MTEHIAGEILSFAAAVMLWISITRPTQKKILLWQSGESAVRVAAAFLLGGASGSAMYLTALIRNLIIISGVKLLNKHVIKTVVTIQLVLGVLTFRSWYDLLAITAAIEYTLLLKNKDPLFTKKNLFANLLLWEVYSIFLGGKVMIITNLIMVITSFADLIVCCRQERKKLKNAGQCEKNLKV